MVKKEAETGIMQLEVKECMESSEAIISKE
jgi:hypothetical protein